MNFRQIHLDFHTSEHIPSIGAEFDKKEWQDTLRSACVNSITCFSCCHHGWSYHPTKIGKMHPNLNFNLLRAQIDACHEIGIKVPIYLTGGINNVASAMHPEWRCITKDGQYTGRPVSPLTPGYHILCFNSPYLDYLCDLLREAVTLFPDADGVFIDIIGQNQCCCPNCMRDMLSQGFDPEKEGDRKRFSHQVLMNYYRRATEAVRYRDPAMRIFHNSGRPTIGNQETLPYYSHLELESLPTGGWGYDHYPLAASYSRKLGLEVLGMTGKFHTTWGEFGGFKHANALRYECAAMLAHGSKCSIGDQLHPCGRLDRSTYSIIGKAYREVAEKEAWCDHVESSAKTAILGEEAIRRIPGKYPAEIGALRLLLELHQPVDFINAEMSFDPYRILILPDAVRLKEPLVSKLKDFIRSGGKLVLSSVSGMKEDSDEFLLDIGADGGELSPYDPDYLLPAGEFLPEDISTPFVMYAASRRIRARKDVVSLGKIHDPYFNRNYLHFCSHLHTPFRLEESGFDAGTLGKSILYFAHPVFTIYREYGNVILKQFLEKALKAFAGNDWQVLTDMPSQGRITIMEQPEFNRAIIHLLYANTILRGGGNGRAVEVIEELNPSPAFHLAVAEKRPVKSIRTVPEGKRIDFTQENGRIRLAMDPFVCHTMLEVQF